MKFKQLLLIHFFLTLPVIRINGLISIPEHFQKPTCNQVQFDAFFVSVLPKQTYVLTNRQYYSETDKGPVPGLVIAGLKTQNFGILVLRSTVKSSFCGIYSVWKNAAGQMLAHQGLTNAQDLKENCIIGFNEKNSSKRTFHFCLEGSTYDVFQLENHGDLENSIFTNSDSEDCNMTTVEKKLKDLPKQSVKGQFRKWLITGISLATFVCFLLLQQLIAYKIDTK